MISPPSISRVPRGLLGFFGIKNGGRNPDALSSSVQASICLKDWYMNTNRQYARTGVNIAGTAFTAFFAAGVGEYFYVQHASFISSALGAGQTLETVLAIQDASGIRQFAVSDAGRVYGAGEIVSVQARDFWLNPGESLGVYTLQLAAGPIVLPIMTMAFNVLAD